MFDHVSTTRILSIVSACLVVWIAPTSPGSAQEVAEDEQEPAPTQATTEMRLRADLSEAGQMDLEIGEVEGLRAFLGVAVASRFQVLGHDDAFVTDTEQDPPATRELQDIDSGFQTPWGNLRVMTSYEDMVEVFFELYISSRPHPEITYGHQGYLLIRRLPEAVPLSGLFRYINIKGGSMEIDYGDHRHRRSNSGDVQQNPLIGNYIVDPESTEIGVEVSGTGRRFNWLAGLTNGTTTGTFEDGTGYGLHGKLWGYPTERLRLSLSGYRVDHSGNGSGFPEGGAKSQLFAGNRSGGPYAAILDGGNAPGQVLAGNGQQVLAGQFDVTASIAMVELYAHLGYTQDTDTNGDASGEPDDQWEYHAAEAVLNVTDRLYMAGRYSGALALELDDEDSSGMVNRAQLGLGYWLTERLLIKAEGVYQRYSDFEEAEPAVSGVNAWREPSFFGGIAEGSYQF